jgi:hypothetical protein
MNTINIDDIYEIDKEMSNQIKKCSDAKQYLLRNFKSECNNPNCVSNVNNFSLKQCFFTKKVSKKQDKTQLQALLSRKYSPEKGYKVKVYNDKHPYRQKLSLYVQIDMNDSVINKK